MNINTKKVVSFLAASLVAFTSFLALAGDAVTYADGSPSFTVNPTYISDKNGNNNIVTINGTGFSASAILELYEGGRVFTVITANADGSISTKFSVRNFHSDDEVDLELRTNNGKSIVANGVILEIEPEINITKEFITTTLTQINNVLTTVTEITEKTTTIVDIKTLPKTITTASTTTITEPGTTIISTSTIINNVTVPATTITSTDVKSTTIYDTTTVVETEKEGLGIIYVVIIGVVALGLGLLIMNIIFRAKYY